jgi:signal transduction histidine kinase
MADVGIDWTAAHNGETAFPDGVDLLERVEERMGTRHRGQLGAWTRGRRRKRRELTPDERAYRAARKRANAKLGFLTHFVTYQSVCVFLLFVAGFRAALVTGLGWGIGIATLEQLSAAIAHEIRNPITAAKSLVQQMDEDPASVENVEYAKVALEELDRVERSISHLLRYAREEEVSLSSVRVSEVVDSALETFRDRLSSSRVELGVEIDSDTPILGDVEKLRRIVINLVGNALDALEESGTPNPELSVMVGENLAGTEVWVRVRDNGPGIEPETLQKIFSPFYTSKENGTGLGLAISKKLVDAHGGSIEATSTPGSGAEFVLTFPSERPAETPQEGETRG